MHSVCGRAQNSPIKKEAEKAKLKTPEVQKTVRRLEEQLEAEEVELLRLQTLMPVV